MPKATVGSRWKREPVPSIYGRWWLPSAPDWRVGGVLEFSAEGEGRLRLAGGLREGPVFGGDEVIHGSSDEFGPVTASAAMLSQRSSGFGGKDDVAREEWNCHTIFLGAHLDKGDREPIRSVRLSTAGLPWWAARATRPRRDYYDDTGSISITISQPPSLSAPVDGGNVMLSWFQSSSDSAVAAEVALEPALMYTPDNHTTFEAVWKSFITPALFLMTTLMGRGDQITEIDVECDSDRPALARVLNSRWRAPLGEVPESSPFGLPLVPFEVFVRRFQEIVPSWFRLHSSASSAMLEYFGAKLIPQIYVEEAFSRAVRGMELFHRVRYGGQILSDDAFNDLLFKVKGSLSGEARRLAMMRLQYANDLTQKNRLDAMIELSGDMVGATVDNFRKFSRRVVDQRNVMTHGGDRSLTSSHMYWATNVIDVVYHAVILGNLGFSESDVNSAIADWRTWLGVVSLANVWVAEANGVELAD
ncbi:ApeA N-terminal domain 1-containing protein [Tenggerimyces flavus]|uniref:HEPN domain-containing protein n=1 Tax=Tenggerimyces flavus TaxID=1708749 RepID=A0ABV7YF96_9ACTN|nr:HEPN domain-containing protein [Tenggerimyces flavus]MBM7784579.1 hypothetical protein [Tenggerimyces flavus]